MFPDQYNWDIFKTRGNRLFLARHAPSSAASSLKIRWDGGLIPVYLWIKKLKTFRIFCLNDIFEVGFKNANLICYFSYRIVSSTAVSRGCGYRSHFQRCPAIINLIYPVRMFGKIIRFATFSTLRFLERKSTLIDNQHVNQVANCQMRVKHCD